MLPYDEEEKVELNDNFYFNLEFDDFLYSYGDYLIMVDDCNFILYMDNDTLNNILQSFDCDYSEYLLDDINSTIDGNFVFLDLLGIKIQKKMYNILLEIENKVEIMYDNFHHGCNDKAFMKELKSQILKRKMFFNFLENRLSVDEYYDLYIYASNEANNNDEDLPVVFEFQDDSFNGDELVKNPMLKAIFYKGKLSMYNIANKMSVDISKKSNSFESDEYFEEKFYLTFLQFLEEEISNTTNIELLQEFRASKYRLMNVLDTVFDTYTFINNKDFESINIKKDNGDYSFIEDMVFSFIDEVLHYEDSKYKCDGKDFYNLINYYFNTIKKLLIKTYYYLTDDKMVITSIKKNPLYGVNNISTKMLDSVIEEEKIKIKTKK